MSTSNFLSVSDFSPSEINISIERARQIKSGDTPKPLAGKILAMIFEKPSLRTRVSFEVGIRQLGGECFYLGREEVGLGTREPAREVSRILDRWIDGIVARVFSHKDIREIAKYTSVPVINALSDEEHPCQAMADILTISEHKGALKGVKVAYIGDGNNVASSLSLACSSVGTDIVLASPTGYQLPQNIFERANQIGEPVGSEVKLVKQPEDAVRDADVVYTDVWASMGQESEIQQRKVDLATYQVDSEMMSLAKDDAIFMHDLPAHEGEEIAYGMLDHPRSVVFDQAENRLHAQKAILEKLFQ